MVKFVKENILTNPADAGVFVLDVDLQGLWLGADHEQFQYAFPKVYDFYKKICMFNYENKVGQALLFDESGYKIALLVTKNHRKTSKDLVVSNFKNSVTHLMQLLPSDVFLYSPILGRRDNIFNEFLVVMSREISNNKEANRIWHVCRE